MESTTGGREQELVSSLLQATHDDRVRWVMTGDEYLAIIGSISLRLLVDPPRLNVVRAVHGSSRTLAQVELPLYDGGTELVETARRQYNQSHEAVEAMDEILRSLNRGR